MLLTLSVRNYALIEKVEIEFEGGLNIITGETGAGKSILIGALSLILGDRADAGTVRDGAEKTIVEAVFSVGENRIVRSFLEKNGLDESDNVIVRREVSTKGLSRAFINDTPVSLNQLRSLGELMVDLHGQHEHQSLLRKETHGDLLDEFAGLGKIREEFQASYKEMKVLIERLYELQSRERDLKNQRDIYDFQIQEIDEVAPKQGEEEQLLSEARILENAEKLFTVTQELHTILYEKEQCVYDQLVISRNQLEDLSRIDPSFAQAHKDMLAASETILDISKLLQEYSSRIDFNPERLEEIRLRLGKLSLLKKKYGGSLDSLLAHRNKIGKEVDLAQNFESEIASIRETIEHARRACSVKAQRLSEMRQEYASKVSRLIEQELSRLGMNHAQMEISLRTENAPDDDRGFLFSGEQRIACTQKGFDIIEFYIAANLGDIPRPLIKIASGGEISRIMLALKTVLAKAERLPLLIFDEIDVGVSGKVAQAVGFSIKKLAQFHQIIAITHLPQIAGLADTHFKVVKREWKGRAITEIVRLDEIARVEEVAQLMSGAEVTDAGRKSASELIASGSNQTKAARKRR